MMTHSLFLIDALGSSGNAVDMQTKDIDRLRGERIVSIKRWKRPLTPEEQAEEELRHQVSSCLDKAVSFKQNTDPQRIVVNISNRGNMLLYVKGVKLQPHKLPQNALLSSYPRNGASYIVIPFDEALSLLAPGTDFVVELKLSQKWQRTDFERIRGELGFLLLDVTCEGRPIKEVLVSI